MFTFYLYNRQNVNIASRKRSKPPNNDNQKDQNVDETSRRGCAMLTKVHTMLSLLVGIHGFCKSVNIRVCQGIRLENRSLIQTTMKQHVDTSTMGT